MKRSAFPVVLAVAVAAVAARAEAQPGDDTAAGARLTQTWETSVGSPPHDDGKKLRLEWKRDSYVKGTRIVVLRRDAAGYLAGTDHRFVGSHQTPSLAADFLYAKAGPEAKPLDASTLPLDPGATWGEWTLVAIPDEAESQAGQLDDEVKPDHDYVYALAPARIGDRNKVVAFIGEAVLTAPHGPEPAWFDSSKLFFLLFILATGAAFLIYIEVAKRRGKDMFIRRIPGVDAIEDAVGRSTEMGRPVLYVTGIEEITSIQTIASLLILGHVAEMTAEYDTEIKVANTYPMTMVVAEEIVRNSYTNVGRADAHRPENVMFITSEQFAFAAAVNGMIIRDKVATNIFLGKFFAESLILAETGFMAGAVQIAGTAEFTQLPFFVAACDYTLIGEELYATGAYLSREPNQVAQIKAGDVMKVAVVALILVGVVAATTQGIDVIGKLIP